jgi:TPR repeat protein
MLAQDSAHSRASGNPASGTPPSRGRAAIGVTATLLLAATLVARWHGAAEAGEPDIAYGAFQRGYYLTAFALATERVEAKKDVNAMTLLGELYAGGLGIRQDDAKAAEWYKLAADRGDRDAMFALAMFRLQGRTGPRDRDAAAKWLAAAAKLGHAVAAYDLALLYIEGQLFPQDFTRAAELLRVAAQAGNPEAQYALGTLYKQGRGVPKEMKEATRPCL